MTFRTRFLLLTTLATILPTSSAFAQGCVAAHANQRVMGQLITFDTPAAPDRFSIHNLTVAIGYRVFNSNKYFVGDEEIPRANATRNHQNIFNIGLEYRLSPRWSVSRCSFGLAAVNRTRVSGATSTTPIPPT